MPLARAIFYASTLAAIAFTLRAALTEPPPLWIALVCTFAYGALVMSGVFVIRLRMFTDALIHGPRDARGVALTFDDGPDPVHTRAVLDALDTHAAKATFFVIGKKAEAHADVVREILARGHTVGVHGFAHDRLFSLRSPRVVRQDLQRAVASLEAITGVRPVLFRPPIGHTNPTIARVAEELELVVVGWSAAARDGVNGTKSRDVVVRITRGLKDGAIVMLHDASERGDREPAAVRALPDVLEAIAARNLSVTSLTSWIE